ncbi:MAG: TerD family protein [Armatimonas sp.]
MPDEVYLRRFHKLIVPPASTEGSRATAALLATGLKNIESLGYTFSPVLQEACLALSEEQFITLYEQMVPQLRKLRGAHVSYRIFYPNFPQQVMEASQAELYLNALLHYWTMGRYLPETEKPERFPLLDKVDLTVLDLGDGSELKTLFIQLAGGNVALSPQDREDLTLLLFTWESDALALLPETVPQKENLALIAGLLCTYLGIQAARSFLTPRVSSATDLLRFAVALSEGDLSLAKASRFKPLSRPVRRLILELLENQANATEDMLRWKGRWIRLGERLHPGEWAVQFPKSFQAFTVLRQDEPFLTTGGRVEHALAQKQAPEALKILRARPGDLARCLDHLLRSSANSNASTTVLEAFRDVAPRLATPLLLQLRHHFLHREENRAAKRLRVFLPKGAVAKAQGIENTLPALSEAVSNEVATICETTLRERFAQLSPLGKVYIDPKLRNYPIPFGLRSASKALRTITRGSRLPLPEGDTIRLFLWWKNGASQTDIDLSAVLFDAQFGYQNVVSYYNLKEYGGVHSGDIVDAPLGASEFIDLSLKKLKEKDIRYIVMSLHSYSRQPFVELPECFAGWMSRQHPGSGEIYEPKTVQDKLDLSADTRIALPIIVDIDKRELIWCDLALTRNPGWNNNVANTSTGIAALLRSMVELSRPNLYDLFLLHTEARGELVENPTEAQTIFSVETGTPFALPEIAASYLT